MTAVFLATIFLFIFVARTHCSSQETDDGVQEPTLCEVCKFMATELQTRLDETGKSKEVIETGHGLDSKKKRKKYHVSELRLIEALNEPHICDKILEYNVHKEKKGSLRFAKGRSETMTALHGLVDKGVKVELGMPYEMWDKPSAEVTQMQRKCFNLVEKYEEEIEDWYFNHQDKNFMNYFCKNMVLSPDNNACLNESPELPNTSKESAENTKSKRESNKLKGDHGNGPNGKTEL
ncbi:hypothetical protein SNE40_019766 [Patella caerulea]|uniref:DUF3456 domain-containing protein n=1 Tax=Patella caerulea TaxID=87958 RepID=A0AAN8PJB1_PATCE